MISKACPLCNATYPIGETVCQECGYDEDCPCCIQAEGKEKPVYDDSILYIW